MIKIITKISNSCVLREDLHNLVDIVNSSEHLNKNLPTRLVKFVSTRWLTHFDMLERFLILIEQIQEILENDSETIEVGVLTNIEIYVISILVKFLSFLSSYQKNGR